MSDVGFRMSDVGCRMLDVEMLDVEMLDVEMRVEGIEPFTDLMDICVRFAFMPENPVRNSNTEI